MFRKPILILFLFFFVFSMSAFAQESQKNLCSVNGTIEEINTENNSFILLTRDKVEKTILTDGKTSFSKDMVIVKFKNFKVGDKIVVSTENDKSSDILAVGIFDEETAFLLLTGQGTSLEYEGKIREIKGNIVTVTTADGEKKFSVTSKTDVEKNLKKVSITDFVPGDEFYAKAKFPGLAKHEPKVIDPVYFKDPISYINGLLVGAHGPMVLRGTVTEIIEKKSSFKIGNEKILANKNTIMLVPSDFRGMNNLKGKAVLVYSITNPIPGRTYVATAVLVEDALPMVRKSLSRVGGSEEPKILTSGKILQIDNVKNKIIVEDGKTKKELLIYLGNCAIVDAKDPARKKININYLRIGDLVQAEGYDTARITGLYIKEKKNAGESRNQIDLNVFFFTDLLGYLQPLQTGGANIHNFLPQDKQEQSVRSVEAGGIEYLATAYKKMSSKTKNNLLICNGNFLFGTPISASSKGEAVVDALNAIGLEAAVIGEQDLYLGKDQLIKLLKKAKFSVLGCNIYLQGKKELFPGLKPYVVLKHNGLKIGLLGILGDTTSVPKEYLKGIAINDPKAALIQYYAKVENESDVVVILANQKFYENYLMANDFENILPAAKKKPVFIICGEVRSTSAANEPINANNILLLEAGTKGRYLAQMSMGFEKNFTNPNYAYYVQPVSPELIKEKEPSVKNVINTYSSKIPDKYKEVLGKALVWVSRSKDTESGLGDLVTDGMIKASGADIALYNGEQLRNDIFEGDITYGLLYEAIPYDFKMVVVEVTGRELKDILEKSLYSEEILQVGGLKVIYKKNEVFGKKIKSVTVAGKEVSDKDVYKVAVTDFLAFGGDNYSNFKKAKVLKEYGILRDIVADYIREIKEVKPGSPERIVAE